MKKTFRLIALLMALSMVAFTLCSCQELDKKKADRAVYNSDRTEITYHDTVYKSINLGKFDLIDNTSVNWDSHYVTAPDVPVLLAESFGNSMQVYEGEVILRTSGYDKGYTAAATVDEVRIGKYDYPMPVESSNYYIRSDKYDEVKQAISDAKIDCYYFDYWSDYTESEYSYDTEKSSIPYAGGRYYNVLLSEELTAAVAKALDAPSNEKVSYKELGTGDNDVKSILLNPCDRNMLLTQSTGQCYLVQDRDKYYFWNGNYYTEYSFVPFNEEETALVKELFEQYPDAAHYDNISWQFTDLTESNNTSEYEE